MKRLSIKELDRVVSLLEEFSTLPYADQQRRLREIRTENEAIALELEALLKGTEQLESFLEKPPVLVIEEEESLAEGEMLGEYRIKKKLGVGGFASVYLADHLPLSREVALKVSKAVGQEAITLARLEHDHIVRVFSETTDPTRQLRWISMQYVAGTSLDVIIETLGSKRFSGRNILKSLETKVSGGTQYDPIQAETRKLLDKLDPVDSALWIGCRLAEALSYAHSRGILHLDVKPSNVLLNLYARPYLTDFNISFNQQFDLETNMRNFGGTLHYMAPEQQAVFQTRDRKAAVQTIDARADIYSLAKVIQELLGDNAVLPKLKRVLEIALSRDPGKRFRSMETFLVQLESCRELKSIEEKLPKRGFGLAFAKKHPLIAITLYGAIPQVLASGVAIYYNFGQIVSQLNPAQREMFVWLNQYVTPAFYPVATAAWVYLCMSFLPFLKKPETYITKEQELSLLRQRAVRIPFYGALVTLTCWLVTSILFPLTIHIKAGALTKEIIGHFLCSFLLSSLIALSYTFLIHLFLTLRVLYLRLCEGSVKIRETARIELKPLEKWLKVCLVLILLIPNLAAVTLLLAGSGNLTESAATNFKILNVSLICFGIAGLLFSLSVGQKILRMILVYSRGLER